jgi:hypothetical protein
VWAGFGHFGFRFEWEPTPPVALRIGIGPSFLWRESWLGVVERYRADGFFGRPAPEDRFQSAWIPDLPIFRKGKSRIPRAAQIPIIPGADGPAFPPATFAQRHSQDT